MAGGAAVRRHLEPAHRALALVSIGQLLALSLWFSASAVPPQLRQLWGLNQSEEPGLTLAVQLGFVAGAMASAVFNLPDVIPTRRLFVLSALLGSLANLGLLLVDAGSVDLALTLRFLVGVCLAGVYPSGLKVLAGWFRAGRGMALGVLVGALTVGSASPHLVRGVGLDARGVLLAASGLAAMAALVMSRVGDGPHEVPSRPFRWRYLGDVGRNRGVRLATLGYLGHMWELYAMWTWVGAYLTASATSGDRGYGSVPIVTFLVIAVGGFGSWWAGKRAVRVGRTRVAGGAMLISGTCAVLTSLVFAMHLAWVLPLLLVWGITVVADSAQFSTMVTEVAEERVRGTALTAQSALGFLLTVVTIRGVPWIAESTGWRWAFPILALGPFLGVWAMARLRSLPEHRLLAGGRG